MKPYRLIGAYETRAMRVLWAMLELGVPFQHVAALPWSKEGRELSPTGAVPALYYEGGVLTDSATILRYLGERHFDGLIDLYAPFGSERRAEIDRDIAMAIDDFDGPLWFLVRARRYLNTSNDEVLAATKVILHNNYKRLEERLADNKYLAGDDFSIADIYLAHCLLWARSESMPETKIVRDYRLRCYQREAAKMARERFYENN